MQNSMDAAKRLNQRACLLFDIDDAAGGGAEAKTVQTKKTESFVKQLMYLINEDDRFRGVTGWSADGKSFAILKRDIFVSQVLPAYYGPIKFESFMKRLFRHGFETKLICTLRRHDTAIFHPYFQRDQPELCKLIVPVSNTKTRPKRKSVSTTPDHGANPKPQVVSSVFVGTSCSSVSLSGSQPSCGTLDSGDLQDGDLGFSESCDTRRSSTKSPTNKKRRISLQEDDSSKIRTTSVLSSEQVFAEDAPVPISSAGKNAKANPSVFISTDKQPSHCHLNPDGTSEPNGSDLVNVGNLGTKSEDAAASLPNDVTQMMHTNVKTSSGNQYQHLLRTLSSQQMQGAGRLENMPFLLSGTQFTHSNSNSSSDSPSAALLHLAEKLREQEPQRPLSNPSLPASPLHILRGLLTNATADDVNGEHAFSALDQFTRQVARIETALRLLRVQSENLLRVQSERAAAEFSALVFSRHASSFQALVEQVRKVANIAGEPSHVLFPPTELLLNAPPLAGCTESAQAFGGPATSTLFRAAEAANLLKILAARNPSPR